MSGLAGVFSCSWSVSAATSRPALRIESKRAPVAVTVGEQPVVVEVGVHQRRSAGDPRLPGRARRHRAPGPRHGGVG